MHIMCFDKLHIPLSPLQCFPYPLNFYLPTLSILFKTQWVHLICQDVHGCRAVRWNMDNLSGAVSLRKAPSPSPTIHQLTIVIHLEVRVWEPLPNPCWDSDCCDHMQSCECIWSHGELIHDIVPAVPADIVLKVLHVSCLFLPHTPG